jgi:polar amino acid transport system substrate-binding protein
MAVSTAVACSSTASSDAAKDGEPSFGECTLTGEPGQYDLKTVAPGVLTIKADVPSAGWWDGDTVADIKSGYEYCMAAEIAYRSGLKSVDLQMVSFDGLVSGQLTGYDMSLDEISITPERQQVVDFSDPYYDSAVGVLAKKGADVDESNLRGLRLGVKQGTAAQQWATDVLEPEHQPEVYPGDAEALAAVSAGRIDAYLQDVAIELGQAKQSGGQVEVVGQYRTDEAYGVMLPKDSANTDTVNKIIADLKADGTLDKLSKTYLGPAFGGDPSAVPVWSAP